MNEDLKEMLAPVWLVIGTIVCILFLMYVLACVLNRMSLPGELAEIEQVRSDVQKIDSSKAEDVAGQAVALNRKIVSNQKYNRIWWADWTIPDEWDNVQLIDISTSQSKGK